MQCLTHYNRSVIVGFRVMTKVKQMRYSLWAQNSRRGSKALGIRINNILIQYLIKIKINAKIQGKQNINILNKDKCRLTTCTTCPGHFPLIPSQFLLLNNLILSSDQA